MLDFEQHIAELHQRHASLGDYSTMTLADLPENHTLHDFREVAKLIELSWAHTYKSDDQRPKSRLVYTPGYLDWALGGADRYKSWFQVVLENSTGATAGICYGAERRATFDTESYDSAIITGRSVHPEHTRRGVGQLLGLSLRRSLLEASGGLPLVAWWDASNNAPGEAMSTAIRRDPTAHLVGGFPMIYKIFDFAEARRILDLRWSEKLYLTCVAGLGKRKDNVDVREMDENDAEEVYDRLIAKPPTQLRFQMRSSKGSFIRKNNYRTPFDDDTFRPLNYVLRQRGEICGAILGYRIPSVQRATGQMMVTDHFLTTPGLGFGLRRRFLRAVESMAAEEHGVYANSYFQGFENDWVFLSLNYMMQLPRPRRTVLGLLSARPLENSPRKREVQIDVK